MLLRKSAAWLVAGLGNPEAKYTGTRHNAGFAAMDVLAGKLRAGTWRHKFQGETARVALNGEDVVLLKPATYMNRSGASVAEAARFYKIPPSHIIILCDDVSLPVGRIRVRASGSAGGHNGLKDIIACLGSQEFPRVRIGVGEKPHSDYDLAAWVLAVFPPQERETMQKSYENAACAALELLQNGPEKAASRYNGK